jgi:hypothetical protein
MVGPVNISWYQKMGWKLPDGMIHPFDFEKIMIDISVGYEQERENIFNYLKMGTGIMILSSPPGFGKTHLLAWLEKRMENDPDLFPVIYYTPPESTGEFVKGLCTQMYSRGLLEVPFFQKLSNLFGGADNYLSRITKADIPNLISNQKKTIVILCDEAQNADPKILNEFKVLRDHPESGDKVRIILAGYKTEKVDLFKKLEATIQDRVAPSNRIYLTGISKDDASKLVQGRLEFVNAEDKSFFEKHIDRIYRFSSKRPREILKICKELVDYCAMNGFLNLSNSIVTLVLGKFVGLQAKEISSKEGKKTNESAGADFSVLSDKMYSIIKVLADHPGSTKEEIAKRTGLAALTVNTLLWRMSKDKDYLEKFSEAGVPIPVIDIKQIQTKKRGRNPSVYALSEQAKVYFAET